MTDTTPPTTCGPRATYVIVHGGTFWQFDTAHDAAMFMWGRDFGDYAVYRRFSWTDGDLHAFERALEAQA